MEGMDKRLGVRWEVGLLVGTAEDGIKCRNRGQCEHGTT